MIIYTLRLEHEEYFRLLCLGLVFKHLLDESDDFLRIENLNVLLVNTSLNHFQIELIIDEAFEEVRLEVDQLEQGLHLRPEALKIEIEKLGDRLLNSVERGPHFV